MSDIRLPKVELPKERRTPGSGRSSPIPPQGEWRLVFQHYGEKNPGEWIEIDHPQILAAFGKDVEDA